MQGNDSRMQEGHITKKYSPSPQLGFTIIFFMQIRIPGSSAMSSIHPSLWRCSSSKIEFEYWFLAISIMLHFRPRGDTINLMRSDPTRRFQLQGCKYLRLQIRKWQHKYPLTTFDWSKPCRQRYAMVQRVTNQPEWPSLRHVCRGNYIHVLLVKVEIKATLRLLEN